MTTSGKAQGAYVVTDAELQSNGGTFRVQPGPALGAYAWIEQDAEVTKITSWRASEL